MIRYSISLILVIILLPSCLSRNIDSTRKLNSYVHITDDNLFDKYYMYVPIAVGSRVSAGRVLDGEHVGDIIVCLGYQLYDALYKEKYTAENFSNYILSLYVKDNPLILSREEYIIVKKYIISLEDAKKYQEMKRKELYMDNTASPFLPNISPRNPTYNERCIIYGYLSRAVSVFIEDESGYLRISG